MSWTRSLHASRETSPVIHDALIEQAVGRFGPGDRIWASVIAAACGAPVGLVAARLLDWSNSGDLIRQYEVKCPQCGMPTDDPVFASLGDIAGRTFWCLTCERPFRATPNDVFVFYRLPDE